MLMVGDSSDHRPTASLIPQLRNLVGSESQSHEHSVVFGRKLCAPHITCCDAFQDASGRLFRGGKTTHEIRDVTESWIYTPSLVSALSALAVTKLSSGPRAYLAICEDDSFFFLKNKLSLFPDPPLFFWPGFMKSFFV